MDASASSTCCGDSMGHGGKVGYLMGGTSVGEAMPVVNDSDVLGVESRRGIKGLLVSRGEEIPPSSLFLTSLHRIKEPKHSHT